MSRSRGKPMRAALVIPVEFIPEPAPQNVTQSGRSRRTCSHCDCCSRPGGAIAISTSSKPHSSASARMVGSGSRP